VIARTIPFDGLTIAYDDRVLAPRPWTVVQSRWGAELAERVPPGPILELFAGAGHIGLDAAVRAGRPLVQVDADPVACELAAYNAAAASRRTVEVRCRPVDRALDPGERFPLILADPPYLTAAEVDRYPDDPRHAVDGGPDGLAVVRPCLQVIDEGLAPGGVALLQLRGRAQAEAVAAELPGGLRAGAVREVDDERAVLRVDRLPVSSGPRPPVSPLARPAAGRRAVDEVSMPLGVG